MRRLVVSIGLCVVSLYAASQPSPERVPEGGPSHQRGPENKNKGARQPAKPPTPIPVVVVEQPDDVASRAEKERHATQREDADLIAQQAAASAAEAQAFSAREALDYTRYAFWLSLAGAFLLAWTLNETRKTANAAIAQTRISENASRAWVGFVGLDHTMIGPENAQVGRMAVAWTNAGGTAAVSMKSYCKAHRLQFDGGNVPHIETDPVDNPSYTHVVPGSKFTTAPFYLNKADFEDILHQRVRFMVHSKVIYKTVFDPETERVSEIVGELLVVAANGNKATYDFRRIGNQQAAT